MDADANAPQSYFRREWVLIFGAILWWMSYSYFRHSVIIDPPNSIIFSGAAIGAIYGAILAYRVLRQEGNYLTDRNFLRIIMLSIITLFCGSELFCYAFEFVEFFPTGSRVRREQAKVVSLDYKFRDKAALDFGVWTGSINVPIDSELYSNLEPARYPGRDCLLVDVQISKSGFRRLLTPNFFDKPMTMNSYHPCNS